MGSQRSAVLACIFREFSGSGSFKCIIPKKKKHCVYLRYIDNVYLTYAHNGILINIIEKRNIVEPSTEFTQEHEIDKSLPFLDNLLIRNHN